MKGYKTGVDHGIASIQTNQISFILQASLTIESPISRIIYIYIYESQQSWPREHSQAPPDS